MHSESGTKELNVENPVEVDDDETVDEDAQLVVDSFPEDDDSEELDSSDNVGDVSVEINVEELIAEIESTHDDDADRRAEVRRRLDEMREQQEISKELEDTFMTYLDDED